MGVETTSEPVFERGSFSLVTKNVETSSLRSSPPKPLLIYSPSEAGSYPVFLFFHGFYLVNTFYSDLLQHIASHGYIVVAPQLYDLIPPSGNVEINYAAAVTNWLQRGLQQELPENVAANLNKLALSGHSRGGKAAFALALKKASTPLSLDFSLLVGIDPVAGAFPSKHCQTLPKILTYVPQSFDLNIPICVIGTGLGGETKCITSCAPEYVNHVEFFNESKPPCCHFNTVDYGHMDMLDDHPAGLKGTLANCICVNGGGKRELMRKCVGGIAVAFLRAHLDGRSDDLKSIVADPSIAPVNLSQVEYIIA